jgi:uncharacterized membrane protein
MAPPSSPPPAATRNIEAVARLELEETRRRTLSDRVADLIASLAGKVTFVVFHLAWFAGWASVNAGLVPGVPAFDPYPFQLLCMIVSMEGVLLSTFVLIKQNRMSARADARSHLDLQVGLLAERETTKIIEMLTRISRALEIEGEVVDAEARELGETTAVGRLAETLRTRMPRAE